jgi:hypothetical protein
METQETNWKKGMTFIGIYFIILWHNLSECLGFRRSKAKNSGR